jgi:hypothetical protein
MDPQSQVISPFGYLFRSSGRIERDIATSPMAPIFTIRMRKGDIKFLAPYDRKFPNIEIDSFFSTSAAPSLIFSMLGRISFSSPLFYSSSQKEASNGDRFRLPGAIYS